MSQIKERPIRESLKKLPNTLEELSNLSALVLESFDQGKINLYELVNIAFKLGPAKMDAFAAENGITSRNKDIVHDLFSEGIAEKYFNYGLTYEPTDTDVADLLNPQKAKRDVRSLYLNQRNMIEVATVIKNVLGKEFIEPHFVKMNSGSGKDADRAKVMTESLINQLNEINTPEDIKALMYMEGVNHAVVDDIFAKITKIISPKSNMLIARDKIDTYWQDLIEDVMKNLGGLQRRTTACNSLMGEKFGKENTALVTWILRTTLFLTVGKAHKKKIRQEVLTELNKNNLTEAADLLKVYMAKYPNLFTNRAYQQINSTREEHLESYEEPDDVLSPRELERLRNTLPETLARIMALKGVMLVGEENGMRLEKKIENVDLRFTDVYAIVEGVKTKTRRQKIRLVVDYVVKDDNGTIIKHNRIMRMMAITLLNQIDSGQIRVE